MTKITSETKRETNLVERLIGLEHYKTDIKEDGRTIVSREGKTPDEAEKRASESYKSGKK